MLAHNVNILYSNQCNTLFLDYWYICVGIDDIDWGIFYFYLLLLPADESEVKAKEIPLNMTGCVTVRPVGGYVYHVQPCNFSLAYSLCENYVRKCNSGFYYPAPNWTFACGYRTRHPFDGRYPIRFSKTEECISSDFSISKDKQFWIGLFALETKGNFLQSVLSCWLVVLFFLR